MNRGHNIFIKTVLFVCVNIIIDASNLEFHQHMDGEVFINFWIKLTPFNPHINERFEESIAKALAFLKDLIESWIGPIFVNFETNLSCFRMVFGKSQSAAIDCSEKGEKVILSGIQQNRGNIAEFHLTYNRDDMHEDVSFIFKILIKTAFCYLAIIYNPVDAGFIITKSCKFTDCFFLNQLSFFLWQVLKGFFRYVAAPFY